MSDTPHIAEKSPIGVDVEAGRTYWWCACGLSKRQPFCDGAHKATSFAPMEWTATETKKVFFCRCKQSAAAPLCDGRHNQL